MRMKNIALSLVIATSVAFGLLWRMKSMIEEPKDRQIRQLEDNLRGMSEKVALAEKSSGEYAKAIEEILEELQNTVEKVEGLRLLEEGSNGQGVSEQAQTLLIEINQGIERNNKTIKELVDIAARAGIEKQRLESTIASLQDLLQVEAKKVEAMSRRIKLLTNENVVLVSEKAKAVEQSAELIRASEELKEQLTKTQTQAARKDQEIESLRQSSVHYVLLADKKKIKSLKKSGVIEKIGSVYLFTSKQFNEADRDTYFSRVEGDVTEIGLGSYKKVSILSPHQKAPSLFKILSRGTNKVLILNKPKEFWDLSNYLIVELE